MSAEAWLAVGTGVAIGLAMYFVGFNYELRWFVALALAIMLVVVVLAVSDRRRLLFGTFMLAFQADLNLDLIHRGETESIGTSGPPGIRLPFVFLAACALFAYDVATGRIDLRRLDYGQPVTKYFTWLTVLASLSLLGAPEKFIGLCALLNQVQLFVIYIVTLNVLRTREDVGKAVNLLMLSLLFQSLLYFVQVMTGASFSLLGDVHVEQAAGALPRHGGTVSMRAADFASFIMPLMFIAIALYFTARTSAARRKYATLSALGMAAMIFTFTRAAWAGTCLGGIVLLGIAVRRRLVTPRTIMKIGSVAAVMVVLSFPLIHQRLGDNHSGAYDERAALMQMAWNVIVAKPLLGAGIGNYSFVVRDYLTRDLQDAWLWIVHNNYLLRAAETGVPAMIVWGMLLWAMVRRAVRSMDQRDPDLVAIGAAWTAGLVAILWEMYWDIWQGFPYNALMWTMWAITAVTIRLAAPRYGTGETDSSVGATMPPLAK